MVEAECEFYRGVQSAEVFKSYADSRAEEMRANERRLKTRVSVLEDQVSPSSFLKCFQSFVMKIWECGGRGESNMKLVTGECSGEESGGAV